MFAGWYPVPLSGWVNLENMSPGTEDRLLPARGNTEKDYWGKKIDVKHRN